MAGLIGPFLAAANRVTAVAVVAHGRALAHLQFAPKESPYPFVAVVPQDVTERLLVEQLTSARDLTSPDNAARAARVLGDLISKARALGATELDADPGFQSALREVTTRVGLTLGLDAVDQGIDRLAGQPGTSRQVAELRKELSWARQEIARH